VRVKNSIATQLTLFSDTIVYTALPAIASTESAIQQNDKASVFSIYPNPARDVLHVKVNGTEDISLINHQAKSCLHKQSIRIDQLMLLLCLQVYTF
jgi:hypothetical protein